MKFGQVNNPFRSQIAKETNIINTSLALHVSADKTSNLYKIAVKNFEKLLQDCLTNKNRKTSNNTTRNTNLEAKQLAQKLKLDDKIEKLPENHVFITIMIDHKLNFSNKINCRLINPAKSNLDRISKKFWKKLMKLFGSLLTYNSGEALSCNDFVVKKLPQQGDIQICDF